MSTERRPLGLIAFPAEMLSGGIRGATRLAGRPLLEWSLSPALASRVFAEVWACGVDAETVTLVREAGCRTCAAPSAITDTVDSLLRLGASMAAGHLFTDVYVLAASNPLRSAASISRAWERFVAAGADALIGVRPEDHPPQWMLTDRKGELIPLDPEHFEVPRQGLVPAFRPAGGHWIARLPLASEPLAGRTLAFDVDAREALTVTTPSELQYLESLAGA